MQNEHILNYILRYSAHAQVRVNTKLAQRNEVLRAPGENREQQTAVHHTNPLVTVPHAKAGAVGQEGSFGQRFGEHVS
jgi:hypothetical protein